MVGRSISHIALLHAAVLLTLLHPCTCRQHTGIVAMKPIKGLSETSVSVSAIPKWEKRGLKFFDVTKVMLTYTHVTFPQLRENLKHF